MSHEDESIYRGHPNKMVGFYFFDAVISCSKSFLIIFSVFLYYMNSCINVFLNSRRSPFSFSDTVFSCHLADSLFISSLGCKALCIVIIFFISFEFFPPSLACGLLRNSETAFLLRSQYTGRFGKKGCRDGFDSFSYFQWFQFLFQVLGERSKHHN